MSKLSTNYRVLVKAMNTKDAVSAIINSETSPLYTPESALRATIASDYLKTLSKKSQKRCYRKIRSAIDKYHTPDKSGNSPHDYNQMMLS